jgi:hypothetical protein
MTTKKSRTSEILRYVNYYNSKNFHYLKYLRTLFFSSLPLRIGKIHIWSTGEKEFQDICSKICQVPFLSPTQKRNYDMKATITDEEAQLICRTQSAGRPSASLSRLANASGERSLRPSSSSSQESFRESKCEAAGDDPPLPLSSPNVRLGMGSAMPRAARIHGEKGKKYSFRAQRPHKFRDK